MGAHLGLGQAALRGRAAAMMAHGRGRLQDGLGRMRSTGRGLDILGINHSIVESSSFILKKNDEALAQAAQGGGGVKVCEGVQGKGF